MATGATVGITVADPDGNIDSGAVETLQAEVRNVDRPGQVRTEVVLTETTPGSALFTGEVLVRQSAVRPTIFLGPSTSINVQPGDDVSVSYSSIGGAGSLVRAATFYVQVVGTITVHPLPLVPGEVALITLQDDDLDRKGVLDQVRVRVTSSREDEPPKEVKLRETGPSTGDFTGALQTVRSPSGRARCRRCARATASAWAPSGSSPTRTGGRLRPRSRARRRTTGTTRRAGCGSRRRV